MGAKQEIMDVPRVLRETLEKGRPEYEVLVRQTRWGEGPIYLVGSGASLYAAMTGAYAFEALLGWPAIARVSLAFATYSISVLRPGSILIAIAPSGESSETLAMARAAKARGAKVLALTSNPESALAKMAAGVFLLRSGENDTQGLKAMVCEQVAISYMSLAAARTLRPRRPELDLLEEEFKKLPQNVESILNHMLDAVRSFASQLKDSRRVSVVGGGFYYPTALRGAHLLNKVGQMHAEAFDALQVREDLPEIPAQDSGFIFVSGSRCRVKRDVQSVVARVKQLGWKIFSITDGNDRELANSSTLGVLLPTLTEMVGSVLAGVLLQRVACELALDRRPDSRLSRPAP